MVRTTSTLMRMQPNPNGGVASPRDLPAEVPLGIQDADVDSKRLFAAAMVGEFICSFCSHPGPHDDIGQGQGSEIAFACAQCGKHLDETALKRSVCGTRASTVPEARDATATARKAQ